MQDSQISNGWGRLALCAALLAAASSGCRDHALGTVRADAGPHDARSADSGPTHDAEFPQSDADVLRVDNVLGWYSQAFEHVGFVLEDGVDPSDIQSCNPYLFAMDNHETWWITGGRFPEGLRLYPYLNGPDEMGLTRLSGTLSPLGRYGHMGDYDRELTISDSELLTCETVRHLGHCVIPRTDDLCVDPEPTYEQRETILAQVYPGPAAQRDIYQLTILYDPLAADSTTILRVSFSLPIVADPEAEWETFEPNEMLDLQLMEDREWLFFERIEYNNNLEGWVMRHNQTDRLKITISGVSDDNRTLHIWVDLPVTEIIFYP